MRRAIRDFLSSPLGVIGLVIVFVVIIAGVFCEQLAPHDPYEVDLSLKFLPPSVKYPLGTDPMGRDMLSRVLYGIRISLTTGVTVLAIAVPIGVIVGAIAGYVNPVIDNLIMRVVDIFLAFPAYILAMAIGAALGASLMHAMLAVATVWWPSYARLVRGQVLSIKENTYVEAARAIGSGNGRILVRHILPNCLSPILVLISMDVGVTILSTAALSFIGLGAQPPTPELGSMIAQGRIHLIDHWWITTAPGLTIFITALGLNLLGDNVRDFLDPQLRGTRELA